MQMTQQQADMLQQQQIQMIQQHTPNEILVNLVKMITTELLKIKDKLEESKKYFLKNKKSVLCLIIQILS